MRRYAPNIEFITQYQLEITYRVFPFNLFKANIEIIV